MKKRWLMFCEWMACYFLKFVDPQKPFSMRLRLALGRLKTGVAIEAVALRTDATGRLQVYLRQRRPNETYAGELHIPGSWFRPGEDHTDVLSRIAYDFERFEVETITTVFSHPWTTREGSSVVSEIHLVRFKYQVDSTRTSNANWYHIDSLRDHSVIDMHRVFIDKAVTAYKAMMRKREQSSRPAC